MSVTTARKERERQEREDLMVEHAQRMLQKNGFQDLNLDDLAAAVEYSKGTIYLHFKAKEDLALAVATRAARERANLFERAARFSGNTRERMRAIGFACCQFAVKHEDYYNVEMMLKSHSFWEKASPERRRQHGMQAARIFHAVNQITLDASRVGDLPATARPHEVSISLMAITIGSHIATMLPDVQMLAGITNPFASLRLYQDILCDGWGWKPLLKDWDYAATDRRIRQEIFPDATWLEN
jgi:AcrR family transcriptional regulator